MYDWAMKCAACGEIKTMEFFLNGADICVTCQEEIIPDQLKEDQLELFHDEGTKG
jgi:uncharacterized protein (DUF983 family)